MFETVSNAPPDAILGLTEAFRADPNPAKINLTVGVYQDADGKTPIMASVKEAERRILEEESTKTYVGIPGSAEYAQATRDLLFPSEHEIVQSGRSRTVQTPGGTGALRVAADFIHKTFSNATIWLSEPTWPNHPSVFRAAGINVKSYPYFDSTGNSLDFPAMLKGLRQIPAADVVLLHGCCHNPTGVDPTAEQWAEIADQLHRQNVLPLLDFAYQGLADGIREDAEGLEALAARCSEFFVASSFSKNFGLYSERVGALTVVSAAADVAEAVLSQLKTCIRANYSNPPAHGAAIVTTILSNPELRAGWEEDVKEIRDRINSMRRLFAETIAATVADRDFSFITRQRGMFSFTGLTPDQVQQLRDKHSIYIVASGRINVAGMNEANMRTICDAIAGVL
jgi:aspartate/tyrosine/aromatic aminotransferase